MSIQSRLFTVSDTARLFADIEAIGGPAVNGRSVQGRIWQTCFIRCGTPSPQIGEVCHDHQ
jgi:hypothetical protein